jgi:RsiW-degrading membrane proteinase PrsW (M82 family)
MNNYENLFTALSAPLLIAIFLLKGGARRFVAFLLLGLLACFFAFYINDYVALISGMDEQENAVKLAPVIEELLKALPVFFLAAALSPRRRDILSSAVAVGLGFALLENAHVVMNAEGAGFFFALLRGLSAGILHTVCGAILGYGMAIFYRRKYLAFPMSFALISLTSTFHAIYHLFVSAGGNWANVGYILPFGVAAAMWYGFRLIPNEFEYQ